MIQHEQPAAGQPAPNAQAQQPDGTLEPRYQAGTQITSPYAHKGPPTEVWVFGPQTDGKLDSGRLDLILSAGCFDLRLKPTVDEALTLARLHVAAAGGAA